MAKGFKKVLAGVILVIFALPGFTGCSSDGPKEGVKKEETKETAGTSTSEENKTTDEVKPEGGSEEGIPKDVVDKYFTDVEQNNNDEGKNIVKDFSEEGTTEEQKKSSDEMNSLLVEKLKTIKHEIVSEKIEGDKATVSIKVTGPNIMKLSINVTEKLMEEANKLDQEGTSPEDAKTKMLEKSVEIYKAELETVESEERTADIVLLKSGGKWEVDKTSEEFLKAVLGEA